MNARFLLLGGCLGLGLAACGGEGASEETTAREVEVAAGGPIVVAVYRWCTEKGGSRRNRAPAGGSATRLNADNPP